jgi:CxxC-x17-CxxC domain-containing protein
LLTPDALEAIKQSIRKKSEECQRITEGVISEPQAKEVKQEAKDWPDVDTSKADGVRLPGSLNKWIEERARLRGDATCANCGKINIAPFKRAHSEVVYCEDCYNKIEEGKMIPLPERMPVITRVRKNTTQRKALP